MLREGFVDMPAGGGMKAVAGSRSPNEMLSRIAATIGCSVEALKGEGSGGRVSEAADLMRFWVAIESPEDRRKLLDFTRGLARPAEPC